MDIKEVNERVQDINDSIRDREIAHALEDKLHRDFIFFIAQGYAGTEVGDMARAVLTTQSLDFSRYCA